MSDPFKGLRQAASKRETAQHEWEQEVLAARAAGYSLRVIADVAGVSHDTVWKLVR
jgi:DNA-binding NarL/FixJ family response regulator